MNRNRRRKAERMNMIKGFNVTNTILEIDVSNSDEKLILDLTDYETIRTLFEFYNKYSNTNKAVKDECDRIMASKSIDKSDIRLRAVEKLVHDFSNTFDQIFGLGACMKFFGRKNPVPALIYEFIREFKPIIASISKMTKNTSTKGDQL